MRRRCVLCLLVTLLAVGCGSNGQEIPADAGGDTVADTAAGEVQEAADLASSDADADVVDSLIPTLIPGPGMPGYDAELEAHVRRYDRQFHVFNAWTTGLNQDLTVNPDDAEARESIRQFLQETDGWDFAAVSGQDPTQVVTGWHKVAGLYGGVGIAADAYRYGVLRDQSYAPAEVAVAREHLLAALEGLHTAVAITGVEGVIARGLLRKGVPGDADNIDLVPLFDEQGNPLPAVKNNGAWRADNSGGLYPDYIWEDSCSRDQYIGWVAAAGAAWEVIRDDETIGSAVKDRLQADARALGHALMVVRESGYDLELPDADGRTTLHGYMNEQCLDSNVYLPGLRNGFHAVMALGAVATWVFVSQDPELESYLYDELIGQRGLDRMPMEDLGPVNTGVGTNFSNYNMAFQGFWLAMRYIDKDPEAVKNLRQGLAHKLYDNGGTRQPREMGQSLFDFVYAAGIAGSRHDQVISYPVDTEAVARGVQTLREFKVPPFWEEAVINCTPEELAAKHCVCLDGETEIDVIGEDGWKGTLVAEQVIPMRLRPPSNYYWRSDPYKPNGGGNGGRMNPGVDLRYAYWLGRWTR